MTLPVPANPGSSVRAALSPVAVGGAVVGALVGLFAVGGLVGLLVVAVIGWLVGAAATVALGRRGAGGSGGSRERIDPFAIGEPWRHFVRAAVTAGNRFDHALRDTRPGPLRDRLASIGESVHAGIRECWEVAKQAQNISQARKALDVPTLRRRLEADGEASVTAGSLRAQLESAERLDRVLGEVTSRLQVLEAQLTEAVTRALEVSALAGHDDELTGVGSSVDEVVDQLEALRLALAENSGPSTPRPPTDELPPGDG